MPAPRERWLDRDAGPFVRPYAVTKGRTIPTTGRKIGLIDVVLAIADARVAASPWLGPEHRQLLAGSKHPVTVVDLASDVDLPVGVVRVLLSDLSEHGMIRVNSTSPAPATDRRLLNEVLDGLEAL